jgi:hypothetical protein
MTATITIEEFARLEAQTPAYQRFWRRSDGAFGVGEWPNVSWYLVDGLSEVMRTA